MRVVSWNLGYWTPWTYKTVENRRRQWEYLLHLEPTLALLQECRPEDLANLVPGRGANFVVVGQIPSGWTACSAIVVRHDLPSILVAPEPPWLDYLSGYVTRAEVTGVVPGVPLRVASVHTPAKEVSDPVLTAADHARIRRTGCRRAWHNDLAAVALQPWVGSDFVVSGDWNTARQFDETYPGKWPDAGKDFFRLLADWGWDETARHAYPSEVPTFRRPGDAVESLGEYQLDHMFTGQKLSERLTRFEILDDVLTEDLSDHALLVADFD